MVTRSLRLSGKTQAVEPEKYGWNFSSALNNSYVAWSLSLSFIFPSVGNKSYLRECCNDPMRMYAKCPTHRKYLKKEKKT
jgi:hypothetical protein